MRKKFQKGIALYLSIVILAIVLAMVLGLEAILYGQIKTIEGMGSSVIALYTADAGIERVLRDYYSNNGTLTQSKYPSSDFENNGSSYEVTVYCCDYQKLSCDLDPPGEDNACPFSSEYIDENCEATKYCVRSVGKAAPNIQKAIEARLFSVD